MKNSRKHNMSRATNAKSARGSKKAPSNKGDDHLLAPTSPLTQGVNNEFLGVVDIRVKNGNYDPLMATAPMKFNLGGTARHDDLISADPRAAELHHLPDRSDDEESDFKRATFRSSEFNLRFDNGLRGNHKQLWAEALEEKKEGES